MFITDEDYRVVIGEQALKVVSQVSEENRVNAETEAVEEIAGYLRPKYDTAAVFSASGSDRNRLVVMYVCDIAIYHIYCQHNPYKISKSREDRYNRAVEWLKGVMRGDVTIDGAPLLPADELEDKSRWQIKADEVRPVLG